MFDSHKEQQKNRIIVGAYSQLQLKLKNIYFNKLKSIKLKHSEVIWAKYPSALTCCIIEPRVIETLPGVLNNMANIYANKNIGLTIFHGLKNETYVKEITKTWKNVNYINMNVVNLDLTAYSRMLTQKNFYKNFKSKFVLIFQWDSYIFKEIPHYYYNFDYVGAPWKIKFGNNCGNGGISLRNVKTMIDKSTFSGEIMAEDKYFSKQDITVCDDFSKHIEFSCESIFYKSPYCCHKPYSSMYNVQKYQEYVDFLNQIE